MSNVSVEIQTMTGQIEVEIDNSFAISKLQTKIESLTSQINTLILEKENLELQITSLQEDNAQLQEQISTLEENIASLAAQITSLTLEKEELKVKLDVLNGEVVENKIDYAIESKNLIKQAIVDKGGTITDDTTLRQYANVILTLPIEKSGDAHTILLMHFDESITKDSSIWSENWAIRASATPPTLATNIKKFGQSSLKITSISQYLCIPHTHFPNFNGSKFTIECWVYLIKNNNFFIFSKANSISGNEGLGYFGCYQNTFKFNCAYCTVSTSYSNLPTNKWIHVAVARSLKTTRLFINGTCVATNTEGTFGTYWLSNTYAYIGVVTPNYVNTSLNFNGYIDELRISDICRYSSDFTPASEPFSS